jgi:formate C-acetyltransferase
LAEEADNCHDPERSKELSAMSAICSRIAVNPPTTFQEALQLVWFMHQLIHIEGNGYSNTADRLDQLLYPFYLRDKNSRATTDDEVLTLLENWLLKMRDNTFWSVEHNLTQGVCLGGSTPEGKDQTNELSWLFLKAAANMRLPEPLIWVRC